MKFFNRKKALNVAALLIAASVLIASAGCGSVDDRNEESSSRTAYGDIASVQQTDSDTSGSDSETSEAASENNSSSDSSSKNASSTSASSESASSKSASSKSEASKAAVSSKAESRAGSSSAAAPSVQQSEKPKEQQTSAQPSVSSQTSASSAQPAQQPEPSSPQEESSQPEPEPEPQPEPDPQPIPQVEPRGDGEPPLVVIDAGHQSAGNYSQEPIGPGAWETKAKVSGGTQGRTTGIPEYELTLALALKLGALLEQQGCEVIQVRTSNDVDISNSERAAVANGNAADVFVRIHANGSDNTAANGAMTICQTPGNPYNGALYEKSRSLSDHVLDSLVEATGCRREYVWETDTMSGINWAQVPVTIVEVGYMSNPEEDILLSQDDYRDKVSAGIAEGIMQYLSEWR